MTYNILIAGFGGQGVLFAAKQIASAGMALGKNVTWLPSYGPESRGGTSNCSVVISDEEIGSPLVIKPDCLIVFNLPSFEKFEQSVKPGGVIFSDSSLVDRKSTREDITVHYVPASGAASDNNLTGFANVIMLGKFIKETGLFDSEKFLNHLIDNIPPSRAALIDKNRSAYTIGSGL
ncbi:MAG: 2-oxoacid:ferredoxin oxidoreductase subunit gamma [Clostridiales bacterium]|nr:2-oxoacid:ferredoxin oxidoreductase subunit gamma [Clostridiales bacterium]